MSTRSADLWGSPVGLSRHRKYRPILALFAGLLLALALTACGPQQPVIYEPANWQQVPNDTMAWFRQSEEIEVRCYRQVSEDARRKTLRVNFEVTNSRGENIRIERAARLENGTVFVEGEMIRLFSPDGLTVKPGEYAEFAAIFEIGSPLHDALADRLTVAFTTRLHDGREEQFALVLVRTRDTP